MSKTFDVIVVGLGAMGSATAYQLAKRGVKVLGLDRFAPPHAFGSSHGDTRITRLACGEGAEYTPFARRSNEIWRELEAGERRRRCWCITACWSFPARARARRRTAMPTFLQTTIDAANAHKVPHEFLSDADIRRRFPGLRHCRWRPRLFRADRRLPASGSLHQGAARRGAAAGRHAQHRRDRSRLRSIERRRRPSPRRATPIPPARS